MSPNPYEAHLRENFPPRKQREILKEASIILAEVEKLSSTNLAEPAKTAREAIKEVLSLSKKI